MHMDMGIDEPLSAEDKKWRAQQDARTLAESDIIKGDEDRLSMASSAAEEMAEKELQEALSLKKVASIYPTMSGR